MLEFLIAGPNVPFVAALVLMLLIGAAELAGLGGAAADIDFDADHEAPSLLSWLNVGRMPLLMLLVVFLMLFGVIGLIGQRLVMAVTGGLAPALLAAPLALIGAVPLTRIVGRWLAEVMPHDETTAVARDSLVGRIAVIVTGQASAGAAAQARARDEHGQPHYVMIEPDEAGEVFAEGQSVIIVRRAGAKFFAVSDETAALHNARSAIPIENRGT